MLSSVTRIAVSLTRGRLFAAMVTQLEKVDRRQTNLLRTLMYHRVDDPRARPDLDPAVLSATPLDFDEQMRFLAKRYCVVSMETVLDACRGGPPLPPRAVLVTFDDAYQDFAEHAWPTLRRYRLPATVFVPTAYPDDPERTFWWDRLHDAFTSTWRRDEIESPLGGLPLHDSAARRQSFRKIKGHIKAIPHDEAMDLVEQLATVLDVPPKPNAVLPWEELRRLAREGVTLAAHTRTHPLLNRVDLDRACDEVRGSIRDLEREIGDTLPVFAFPSGELTAALVRELPRLQVSLAVTTVPGIDDLTAADPRRLRRINVGRNTNLGIFRARLLSWFKGPKRKPVSSGAAASGAVDPLPQIGGIPSGTSR